MPMGLSGDRAGCAPPLGFSAQAGDFTGGWVCLSCAGFLISRLHQGSIVCGWYDDLGNDVCFCAGEALLTMQRGFEVAKQGGGGNKGGDRKHQWGAETSTQPLAIMHDKPSPTRVVLGYVAIACTVISWLIYMITMILSLFVNNPSLTLRFVVESVLYMTIVTTLIFSALVYLATRQGALYRFIRHERVPRDARQPFRTQLRQRHYRTHPIVCGNSQKSSKKQSGRRHCRNFPTLPSYC